MLHPLPRYLLYFYYFFTNAPSRLMVYLFQNIIASVSPGSACLSADANFTTVDGKGIFLGSVCSATAGVTVTFDAVSVNTGLSLASDNFGPITFNSKSSHFPWFKFR